MSQDLVGKVALVTGASRGLGLAAAQALLEGGARVAISSRGGTKLEAAETKLLDSGGEAVAVAADVRDPEALEELVSRCEELLGPVDILVANGGGPPAKPAAELNDSDWMNAIPFAFLFVPRLCNLVLPGMRRRGWGRIVAINSVSAKQPIPDLALSNSLRPAVLGYLKTLAQEVAADGVTVNAVLPGFTRTQRQAELAESIAQRQGSTVDSVAAERGWNAAAGRMAEPNEIAAAIAFLASPAASYITGQALTVDGGYVRGLL